MVLLLHAWACMAHITDVNQVKIDIEPRNESQQVVDPVCGMKLQRRDARFATARPSGMVYFCSRECRARYHS